MPHLVIVELDELRLRGVRLRTVRAEQAVHESFDTDALR